MALTPGLTPDSTLVPGAPAAGGQQPGRPETATSETMIRLADVIKVYREVDVETVALRGIDLEIGRGEFVALMGRSGSGKSTLLHLLAGSDRPTAGRVVVDGVDLSRADEVVRGELRGSRVGIVFQSQNLVSFLDLVENVMLATALAGRPIDPVTAAEALTRVGLGERLHHRPEQLSGGEQQRAALVVVTATDPLMLLADEISGELDSATAATLLDLLVELHGSGSLTIVLATHDPEVAARATRIVELDDGRIVGDRRA